MGKQCYGVLVYDDTVCSVNESKAVQHPGTQNFSWLAADPKAVSAAPTPTGSVSKLLFAGAHSHLSAFVQTDRSCGVPVNFEFKQGTNDLAVYDWSGGRCEVSIFEQPAQASASPKPVARFTSEVTKENAGCMAAAIKPRAI